MAVVGGVKTYATAMILGATAPLVVAVILVQRVGRRKVAIQARRVMTRVGPQIDRASEERERWRNDLAIGELIEWALESPVFNPRPKG